MSCHDLIGIKCHNCGHEWVPGPYNCPECKISAPMTHEDRVAYEDKIVQEYLAARNETLSGRLDADALLLNAFEHACVRVIEGAEPDTPAFIMYAHGRRLIIEKMKS